MIFMANYERHKLLKYLQNAYEAQKTALFKRLL